MLPKAFFRYILSASIIMPAFAHAQQSDLDALANEFKTQKQLGNSRYFVGEELVFSIQADRFILGEVYSLVLEAGIAFDLESYSATFDFPIKKSALNQSFEGWFISEDNGFKISLPSKDLNFTSLIAQVNDREVEISPQEYKFENERLYILESVYQKLFGINHSLVPERLSAKASSTERLPFLTRLTRQKGRYISGQSMQPSFVNLPRGYELLSPQILDIQGNLAYRENSDDFNGGYSVQGVRDIALWSTRFSLVGNEQDWLNSTRFNFSRESGSGDVFGDTGITQFEIGDVRDIRQASGSSLNESLGFRFSNAPLQSGIENNVTQLDGDIPLGWDAELYRNNILLRQEFDIQTGRYNFLDVPLIFGNNNFEILLYGPQGQIRRVTESKLIDEKTFSSQPFKYEVSLTDTSSSLINSGIDDFRNNSGYNFSARMNSLIADATTLDLGVRSQFGGDQDNSLVNLGINTVFFDNVLFSTFLEGTDKGVVGLSTNARTNILGQSMSLNARLDDINEKVGVSRSFITLGIDGNIPVFPNYFVPLSQQITFRNEGNLNQFLYSNRIGLNFGRVSLFNSLNYERTKNENDDAIDSFFGNASLQFSLGDFYLRGGATYDPDGETKISAMQANIGWNISKSFRANFSYQNDFINDFQNSTLFLSYLGSSFTFSSRFSYSDLSGYNIGLNASFSLSGQNQSVGRITNSAIAQRNTGSLTVRVFLDKNLNSIFDENDQPLSGVGVKALQFFKNEKTDDEGIATLTRLPDYKSSDIVIDRVTLPDSFYMPRVDGVSITTRAGLADFLDFPVIPSSEISGVIDFKTGESLAPAPRVTLNLKDKKSRLIATTNSEFDGFYSFVDVPPGNYLISVDESSEERFDIRPYSLAVDVGLTPDVINRDLVVEKYNYETLYVSEVASIDNNSLTSLAFIVLKRNLSSRGIDLFRFKVPRTETEIFYVSVSKNEAEIEQVCKTLKTENVSCQTTRLTLKLEE